MHTLLLYLAAHPALYPVVASTLASVLVAALRLVRYVVIAVAGHYSPRARNAVEGLIALIPAADIVRGVSKLIAAATDGRVVLSAPPPDPRDARLAQLAARVAELEAQAIQARPVFTTLDTSARDTVAPPAPR
jgi:predicted TIM-barrel enzyme